MCVKTGVDGLAGCPLGWGLGHYVCEKPSVHAKPPSDSKVFLPFLTTHTPTIHNTHQKAAEVNLVGCQFGPKDAALWKKTGQMFLELGRPYYMKAQYCFGRAIKVFGVHHVWDDDDGDEEEDDRVLVWKSATVFPSIPSQ